MWAELADKTDAYGFSFKQAIFSGCKTPDSGVGIYAGSPDSYVAFKSLFEPVVNQYHRRQPGMLHESDMNYEQLSYQLDRLPE